MGKRINASGPTKAQAEEFDMLWPILQKLLNETKELPKKKADGPLNKIKVNMINKVLTKIKQILSNDPSVQFLEILDTETLPSNSDAVFIMAQFDAAMSQFKEKHYRYDPGYGNIWFTSD